MIGSEHVYPFKYGFFILKKKVSIWNFPVRVCYFLWICHPQASLSFRTGQLTTAIAGCETAFDTGRLNRTAETGLFFQLFKHN